MLHCCARKVVRSGRVAVWPMPACLLVMPKLQTREKVPVFSVQAAIAAGTLLGARASGRCPSCALGVRVELLCEACHLSWRGHST